MASNSADKEWVCLVKESLENVTNGIERFKNVIDIWWRQPQACNRRLCGCLHISAESQRFNEIVKRTNYIFGDKTVIKVRKLLPKRVDVYSSEAYEVAIENCENAESSSVHILPVTPNSGRTPAVNFDFSFRYHQSPNQSATFEIWVPSCNESDTSATWLKEDLFKRLMKWMHNCQEQPLTPNQGSHCLIDMEKYNQTYQRLKSTYAPRILHIWPERTDPQKFVFEDISIASYLMELWSSDDVSTTKTTFLDLGCGNGLLVDILRSQGFDGTGIDVRSRKIWSMYENSASLKEVSLDPTLLESTTCENLPAADWLIGNHSDELTPWIPILAARRRCSFFILPCCAFDFYAKFKAKLSNLSVYESYLAYVKRICIQLGFDVEVDRLKIPSTKRTCFVGRPNQNFPSEAEIAEIITKLLKTDEKTPKFTPRPTVEAVRNCSQLPRDFQSKLTLKIFHLLLDSSSSQDAVPDSSWDCGITISLNSLSSTLTDEERTMLKSQCGGLQTFLKNKHQLFIVRKGSVSIRDWRNFAKNKNRVKKWPCFFHENHPQGCPLSEGDCSYIH